MSPPTVLARLRATETRLDSIDEQLLDLKRAPPALVSRLEVEQRDAATGGADRGADEPGSAGARKRQKKVVLNGGDEGRNTMERQLRLMAKQLRAVTAGGAKGAKPAAAPYFHKGNQDHPKNGKGKQNIDYQGQSGKPIPDKNKGKTKGKKGGFEKGGFEGKNNKGSYGRSWEPSSSSSSSRPAGAPWEDSNWTHWSNWDAESVSSSEKYGEWRGL